MTTQFEDVMDDLVAIRRQKGLTTSQVARRMHVSSSAVSYIESSARKGNSLTLHRILDYANAIGADLYATDEGTA